MFLDRRAVGVLARDHHDTSLALPAGAGGRLELLVEDQGRVDYGPRIGEPKGLIGPVSRERPGRRGWQVRPIRSTTSTALADPARRPTARRRHWPDPSSPGPSSTSRGRRRRTCS